MLIKLLVSFGLLASSGCIIHAVEKEDVRTLGTVVSPSRYGTIGPLVVTAQASSTTLTIQAARQRTCSQNVYEVTEVRTYKEADVDAFEIGGGGGGGGPVAFVYLFVIGGMAATGIISGSVTAIELAVSDDRIERRAKLQRVRSSLCAEALPDQPIDVTLPSGAMLSGTTDAAGKLTLEIPETEPAQGEVFVRIRSAAASTRVAYDGVRHKYHQ